MYGLDILELQKKLTDAQEQQQRQPQTRSLPYRRMRTAAINEAVRWLREGMSLEDTTSYFQLSVPTLNSEMARRSEYDKARRRFLATGRLPEVPGEGAYVAIIK